MKKKIMEATQKPDRFLCATRSSGSLSFCLSARTQTKETTTRFVLFYFGIKCIFSLFSFFLKRTDEDDTERILIHVVLVCFFLLMLPSVVFLLLMLLFLRSFFLLPSYLMKKSTERDRHLHSTERWAWSGASFWCFFAISFQSVCVCVCVCVCGCVMEGEEGFASHRR